MSKNKSKHHSMKSFIRWWIDKVGGEPLEKTDYLKIEKKYKNDTTRNNTDVQS